MIESTKIARIGDMVVVKEFRRKIIGCYPSELGDTMTEDIASILSIIAEHDVRSYLEIGTWRGYMGYCVWMNSLLDSFATMDIMSPYQDEIAKFHQEGMPKEKYGEYLKFCPVKIIEADSRKYVPAEGEKYDMVFVDGCHKKESVLLDYALARKMATKIIGFHDLYNGNLGVDAALEEIAKTERIFKSEKPACVAWIEVGR